MAIKLGHMYGRYGAEGPVLTKLQNKVLSRMKPETEIVPGVKGEPFATTPPPSNPTEDNPSLVSPIANPFTQPTKKTEPEGLAVDGEDRRIPGAWIQSDGGGILFEENLPPDGDDGPSG